MMMHIYTNDEHTTSVYKKINTEVSQKINMLSNNFWLCPFHNNFHEGRCIRNIRIENSRWQRSILVLEISHSMVLFDQHFQDECGLHHHFSRCAVLYENDSIFFKLGWLFGLSVLMS